MTVNKKCSMMLTDVCAYFFYASTLGTNRIYFGKNVVLQNQVLTYTDPNNNIWTRNYDEMGRLTEIIDPEGNVTTNEYTTLGQIAKTITPDNALWERSYDMAGRIASATDPLGAVTSYGYDERGRVLFEEDPMGRIDTYTWDSLGCLASTRDGENSGVDYTYDVAGNRTSETQTGGTPYQYFYDSRNRLNREVNRLNDEKLYDYYRNGQIKTITDFNGDVTSFTYNEASRLAVKEFENGSKESYTYDGMGNLLTAINPSAELEYTYDPLGRLTESIDHFKDQVISYGYDPSGNRTSLTWADDNRTTTWDYNTLNLPVTMTDPEGEVTQFTYDPMGRETARILPNGITRETMFNEAGRITSISHTGGKSNEILPAQFYAYNDARQKVLQLDETGRVTAWEYDNAGRLAESSYAFAGGKSVTDFWERIYLGVIPEDIANGVLNETDTLTAEIETLVNSNPILGELGFTNKNYMENLDEAYLELSSVFPDLKNHDFTAAAKPKNDFTFKANWGHLHKFLPDEIDKWFNPGHIADLLEQPQWTESFTYDMRGNITNKTKGWGDISYTYNAENQLVKAGIREYSFDNNGNMTAEWTGDLTATYAYDAENRLTEVTTNHQGFIGTPGSLMVMGILYSYDSLGRRVSREEITDMQNGDYRDRFGSSGERMSYLYDGLSFNMLAEGRDASGIDTNGGWHSTTSRDFKPTSEYLRTNGRVITRTDVTTEGHSLLDSYYGGYLDKGYYMEDSLGSVMGITNSKGSITESYSYDSFGRLTEGRFDDINRLGYNGKRVDPFMGRYDYGFRDYDPVQMRFTTVDPVKDQNNWYAYVNNDPVNKIDLWGLQESDQLTASDAVLGITAGTAIVETVLNVSVTTVISSAIQAAVFASPLLITSDVQHSNITMAVSDDNTGELLAKNPTKLNNADQMQPYDPSNGQYMPSPPPGPEYSAVVRGVIGAAKGYMEAKGATNTGPPPLGKAGEIGYLIEQFLGNL